MDNIDISQIREPNIPQPGRKEKREEDYLLSRMKWKKDWEYVIHCARILIFIVCVALLLAAIIIRSFALFLPNLAPWMMEERIKNFDEFFIHGTIGAVVAGVLRKSFKYELAE